MDPRPLIQNSTLLTLALLLTSFPLVAQSSTAKSVLSTPTHWKASGQLSMKKSVVREDSKEVLEQAATISYEPTSNWDFGINQAFESPIEVEENQTSRYGLQDLEIYASHSFSDVTLTLTGIAPTSTGSRDAYMNAGVAMETAYTYKRGLFQLRPAIELFAYSYQYETSDELGTSYNVPFAQWYKLSLMIKLHRKLSTNIKASYFAYRNYAGTENGVNRFSTSLLYTLSKNITAHLDYRAQSGALVTTTILEEMNSLIAIGLLFSI